MDGVDIDAVVAAFDIGIVCFHLNCISNRHDPSHHPHNLKMLLSLLKWMDGTVDSHTTTNTTTTTTTTRTPRDCFAHLLKLESDAANKTTNTNKPGEDGNRTGPKYFYHSADVSLLGGSHKAFEQVLSSFIHARTNCASFKPVALATEQTQSHL